jgi:hypothetical protein
VGISQVSGVLALGDSVVNQRVHHGCFDVIEANQKGKVLNERQSDE